MKLQGNMPVKAEAMLSKVKLLLKRTWLTIHACNVQSNQEHRTQCQSGKFICFFRALLWYSI